MFYLRRLKIFIQSSRFKPSNGRNYPSTRLIRTFLLRNNEMYIIKDKKNPKSIDAELSCIKHAKTSKILIYLVNKKIFLHLMRVKAKMK